jgi:hypothetical protein
MKNCPFLRPFQLLLLPASLCVLSGCSDSFNVPDTVTNTQGAPIVGSVFGGHSPLVGAHVYLLQVGNGAIGTQATSLLGTMSGETIPAPYTGGTNTGGGDAHVPTTWHYITTDSNGTFNLTGDYLCTGTTPVYIYATGGNPGGNTAPNPAAVNLAVLGNCPSSESFATSIRYVYVNEVSTVAAAYALQGFTSAANNDATHIGYSGANSTTEAITGIRNAAGNAAQLYDIQGSVTGHAANYNTYATLPNNGKGVVPQAMVDTLANILAACVDSGNSVTAPNSICSGTTGLLTLATADGTTTGTQPTDTATAAINIARHPSGGCNSGGCNTNFVANIYDVPQAAGPFSPALSNQPPDFTVAINFPSSPTYPQFTGAFSVATDSTGDFWFTNWTTAPNPATPAYGSGYMAMGTPLGIVTHTSSLLANALGNVAIDSSQNAWAGTYDVSQGPIYEDGPVMPSPTAAYTFASYGIGFSNAASPVADNSTNDGDLYFSHGPTCPTPANGCVGAQNNPTLTIVLPTGTQSTPNSLLMSSFATIPVSSTDGYPTHGAIDTAGYDWLTSDTTTYGNIITRVLKTSGAVASSNFPINANNSSNVCGGSFVAPEQPAIDAKGNAWIPIYGGGSGNGVYVINPTGSTCSFYPTEGFLTYGGPYGAAVDGSNNVWVTNLTDGSLTELSANGTPGTYPFGSSLSSAAFQPVNSSGASILNHPMSVAVDISGDVFIANYANNSIVELIGLATPVFGPLGVAAATNCNMASPPVCAIGTAP